MKKAIILILCFILFPSFTSAQNSNPDGILFHPTVTFFIGFDGGGTTIEEDHQSEWGNWHKKYEGDSDGHTFFIEAILPASSNLSFIVRFNASWQTFTYPNLELGKLKEISNFRNYSYGFGCRIFSD